MNYMGQDTQAGGMAVVQYTPDQFLDMAQKELQPLPQAEQLKKVLARTTSYLLTLQGAKRMGPTFYTSAKVSDLIKQYAIMTAYQMTFEKYNETPPAGWSTVNETMDKIEVLVQELSKWDRSLGDAALIAQQQKREALESGDLSSPVFTDAERAYYRDMAKAGQLSVIDNNQSGLVISEAAQSTIADYSPPPAGPRLSTLAIGGVALAVVAFLVLNR